LVVLDNSIIPYMVRSCLVLTIKKPCFSRPTAFRKRLKYIEKREEEIKCVRILMVPDAVS
jgi:hypothetical protein